MRIGTATVAPSELQAHDVPIDARSSEVDALLAALEVEGRLCDIVCEVDQTSRETGIEHVASLLLAESSSQGLHLPATGALKHSLDAAIEGLMAALSKPESVAALLPTLQGKWRPGLVKTIIAGPRSTEVRVLSVVPYSVGGDA